MTIHLLEVYMCVPPSVVIILMSHFMFIVREEQVRVDLAHWNTVYYKLLKKPHKTLPLNEIQTWSSNKNSQTAV